MDSCDVLIAGGGPAGSSCAWGLRGSGLDVVILDRARFPRDKVCGGWITPAVVDELHLDLSHYSAGRVLQPITGFRTSAMGSTAVRTDYGRAVSYGIRRCEFDQYLLARSGARVFEQNPIGRIERRDGSWIVNGSWRAKVLVGAGGHFCPVARHLGARLGAEPVVAAQEAEFPLDGSDCAVQGEVPELFFCSDMKGYGWCFRKSGFLNVGLGRMDRHDLVGHVRSFIGLLRRTGRLAPDFRVEAHGHAYLLYGNSPRDCIGDGVLLVGDAAGLAWPQSGEGIRPAVESGLIAACVIAEATGNYARERLERYGTLLEDHMGKPGGGLAAAVARFAPDWAAGAAASALLRNAWLTRRVLLDRWFLGSGRPLPAMPHP